MNPLIQHLYDQALAIEGNGDYVTGELDPELFAHMIIHECAHEAWRKMVNLGISPSDANQIVESMKNKFRSEA